MPDYASAQNHDEVQNNAGAALAGLDVGNQAAVGQSAELTGATGGPGSAAAEQAKEAKRVAKAQADWEGILGEKLGGKLFELIRKHVSYGELTGHAHTASKGLADALAKGPAKATEAGAAGGIMDEASEAEAVNKLLAAFAPAIQEAIDKWIKSESGQKLFTGISEWVEEHPRTILGLAGAAIIGAAVGAYLSNMNPGEFDETFKISEKWSAGGSLDLPGLQDIMNQGVEAASLFVEYKGKEVTGKITGTYSAENGSEVSGELAYASGPWSAKGAGKYSDKGHEASASLSYANDGVTAGVTGKHTGEGHEVTGQVGYASDNLNAEGHVTNTQDGTTGGASVSGSGRVANRYDGTYSSSVEIDKDGQATVKLDGGLSGLIGDTEAEAGIGLSRVQGGEGDASTRLEATLKLGAEGDSRSFSGWMDPETDAFAIKFDRTALGGAFTQSQGIEGDANGDVSQTTDLKYATEGFAFGAGAKQGAAGQSSYLDLSMANLHGSGVDVNAGLKANDGQVSSYNLGAGFDLGQVRTELDLEMKDGVTALSGSATGSSGDFTYGGNTRLNLTAGRIDELGLKLGWKDPDKFRSFTADYKLKWMEENAEYAHNFDAQFEYAVDKVSMRLKGGMQLQGGGLTSANVDALAGYKLDPNWAVIAGADYRTQDVGGMRQDQFGVRAGVQYKGIAVTAGVTRDNQDNNQFGIRLEIPLGW